MTNDVDPEPRASHAPRLIVARGRVRSLARMPERFVLSAADLTTAADGLAAERSASRAAARARLDAIVARVRHEVDLAVGHLDDLRAVRRSLLDGAAWAVGAQLDLPALLDAVSSAREVTQARQIDVQMAQAGLARLLEQRAAAMAAIQEADRELEEIGGLGMDESGLRRELEAAGDAVRVAHDAHAEAAARLHAIVSEQDALEARCACLNAVVGARAPVDHTFEQCHQSIADAFAAWSREATTAGSDLHAVELADSLSELLADLAEAEHQCGPRPDKRALTEAQARVDATALALGRLHDAATVPVLSDDDRAELHAAHAAVVNAAERCGRGLRRRAADRRLDEAHAVERALLGRFGLTSYLDVVLTGGRTLASTPARLAAEQAYLAAKAQRDGLERAARLTPELEYLYAERARLLNHARDHLGVDPGDRLQELLRSHPAVAPHVLHALREALAAAGICPVGRSLGDAAEEWLVAHPAADGTARVEAADEAQAELEVLTSRRSELVLMLAQARQDEAQAAEQLELASRSVGAVEAELTARAGEDSGRVRRLVAAEQLRAQVAALETTLARAEHDARAVLDRATADLSSAEEALDRAEGGLTELARRARSLAASLPRERRPAGDRLGTLAQLADALNERARAVQPQIEAAETVVGIARADLDDAAAAVAAAASGADGPRAEDVIDGLDELLAERASELVVLDDPFPPGDAVLGRRLCEVVVAHAGPVLLLTEEPDLLGWSIGLPADTARVVSIESLLNLWPCSADTSMKDLAAGQR